MHELLTQLLTHVRGMWRFRWYALFVAWLICGLGWAYVYALPDQYKASARVYVDTQSFLKPLLKGLAVESDIETRVNVMTRTLLSRPNLEKVARKTDLDLRAVTPKAMNKLLVQLQRTISIKSDRREDNLYTITYTDKEPRMAQSVVQTLMNTLVGDTLGSSRNDALTAQRFLSEQIRGYTLRLETAEQRLADFKKKHVGMMPSEGKGYYARLQAALGNLEETRTALRVAENRRDELLKQIETEERSSTQTVSSDLTIKINDREAELDTLLLKYTELHPDVLALKQTIARLKERQEREKQELASGQRTTEVTEVHQAMKIELSKAEVDVATLRTQVADQQRKIDQLRQMMDTIPEIEAKLARLNRDYSITKAQYEKLVQRRESARLSEQAEESSDDIKFRIIDPPIVPLKPIGPNRPQYLSAVFLVGLLAGVALAFFLNDIRPVFLNSKSLQEVTGLPVLGVVSMKWQPKQRLWLRAEFASFVFAGTLLIVVYGGVVLFEDRGVQVAQSLIRMI